MSRIRSTFLFIAMCSFSFSCGQPSHEAESVNDLFASPSDSIQLFGEGLISRQYNERDLTLSPDGNEIFFSLVSPKNTISSIIRIKKEGDHWGNLQTASFSGRYSDLEPTFSPDGSRLFFISKRPLRENEKKDDWDIWFVERTDQGWSIPKNIGAPINTAKDEYYPSIATSGNLYFTAAYDNAVGREDIYLSTFKDGQYQTPVPFDTRVNSTSYEFNAYVSPDEDFIFFSSFGRPDGLGGGDIYFSKREASGHWSEAKNMGPSINSTGLGYCPFIDSNNKYFFFTSDRTALKSSYKTPQTYTNLINALENPLNGLGNIYWINLTTITDLIN